MPRRICKNATAPKKSALEHMKTSRRNRSTSPGAAELMRADPWVNHLTCRPRSGDSGAVPSFLYRGGRLCGEIFGRFSHFLECAHFNLPDAFSRHVELCRELLERQWFVDQMSRFENATFAVVQDIDGGDQCVVLVVFLVLFDHKGFGRGGLIDE